MAIQDFTTALKSKAMRDWFQRLSTDNILKIAAKDIRRQEVSSDYNSFYITEDTIADILNKLNGSASQEDIDKVFAKLRVTTYGASKHKGIKIAEPYVQGTGLYFPKISFANISSLLESGFSEYATKDSKISDYFQQGHVYGIFPKKISQTRKSLEAGAGGLQPEQKALLVGILKDLEAELMAEDLASSNLKTNEFSLYAKYSKNSSRYLVEMQLKEVNEAAGREQSEISKAIRKYFDPGAVTVTKDGGIKFTEGAGAQKIKNLIMDNINKVYGSKGSPSYPDLIVDDIYSALSGKPKRAKKSYTIEPTLVIKNKAARVDTSKLRASISEQLASIRQAIKTVNAAKVGTNKSAPSAFNLQAYLSARLAEQIKKNMGTGYDKKVLNYRTGRLAESATIERLSYSREGMVSVFYNYMRNPYGTFSAGGAQERPTTRDPKTLISKSIREIGAAVVGNRMRAILV